MSQRLALALVAIFVTSQWEPVSSHGRFWSPPGRATMWRRGFKTPANFDDNQMFCGGLSHEKAMGYKCGICGDPYDSNRPHEAGGKFATGTIATEYTQGQEVDLQVDLTANHKGWFEFKICPVNDYKTKATQACLDLHPLQLSDGSGTKLDVSNLGSAMITIPVKLPKDMTCDQCVLQWRYHGGNNWGTDPGGKSCLGCGYTNQEEFYGCADVKIKSSKTHKAQQKSATVSPDILKLTTRQPVKPTPTAEEKAPSTPFLPPHADKPKEFEHMKPKTVLKCKGLTGVPGMSQWCYDNCNAGNCPASQCKCKTIKLH